MGAARDLLFHEDDAATKRYRLSAGRADVRFGC
jgi:hypothetical protein